MRRLDALSFRQLRALEAVARTGSITEAAAESGLTAPAIHSQLRTLEDHFGVQMVARKGSGRFSATTEGAALISAHLKARAALEMAIHRIEALQAGFAGNVVLGVVSTGKYFAPGLVAQLRREHPDIEISLKIGNRDAILAALQAGSLDMVIMGRPPRDPPVEAIPIGEHPHLIVAAPDHPLAKTYLAEPDEILAEPILTREPGSGTRILAERYLDRIGEGQVYERIEMDSNETIKQAVIAGLGIALISAHTVTEELSNGRLGAVRARGLPIMRHWYVLHRRDADLSGAQIRVRDFIEGRHGAFLPRLPLAFDRL